MTAVDHERPPDVLVAAGLMTDVPPCSCAKTVHRACVHHGENWLRIRSNLEVA